MRLRFITIKDLAVYSVYTPSTLHNCDSLHFKVQWWFVMVILLELIALLLSNKYHKVCFWLFTLPRLHVESQKTGSERMQNANLKTCMQSGNCSVRVWDKMQTYFFRPESEPWLWAWGPWGVFVGHVHEVAVAYDLRGNATVRTDSICLKWPLRVESLSVVCTTLVPGPLAVV